MNINFSIFNNISELNISLSSYFKLFIILFLIIVNIYLIYFNYNSPNRDKEITAMESGIIDGKYFKNLGGYIGANIGLYVTYLTITESNSNKIKFKELIKKQQEENDLLKRQLNEAENITEDKINAGVANLSRSEDLLNNLSLSFQKMNNLDQVLNYKLKLLEGISAEVNNSVITDEIAKLRLNKYYENEKILKHLINLEISNTELKGMFIEEMNKNFIFNPFEYFNSLDVFEKIAVCTLLLNQIILSALTSIVFIFYGDYLLEKYKIEQRFPKLAIIIKLRRKFQRYYLIMAILLILSVSLSQILFSVAILTK